ncbi:hypothetical protein SLA2020_406690 [Shorea laevis]
MGEGEKQKEVEKGKEIGDKNSYLFAQIWPEGTARKTHREPEKPHKEVGKISEKEAEKSPQQTLLNSIPLQTALVFFSNE